MATTEANLSKSSKVHPTTVQNETIDNLVSSLARADLQESGRLPITDGKEADRSRMLCVYTRPQLLHISKSPLVEMPDEMPSLKDWFGDWNEQQVTTRKDTDSSGNASSPRDRRFRRDAEDGDTPSRPSFRSSLSQPSQMGNFRHQSLRTTDRDRDRDPDRERERDLRDREGQERLRNLSDKYDRDRLAGMTSATSALRSKDKESAAHVPSSARIGQGNGTSNTRRTDAREPGKKKPGESSDDWRRGAEPSRAGRDDRSDTKRERDTRERPRSRARDSSRPRRDPSTGRRDRDRDDYSRRDRDDHYRRDWDDNSPRDRDDYYRDRDRYDHGRSQRDLDRDLDDDPRRWRDDGKRDERIAARRERDHRDRGWDRWEPSHDRDRLDDRDTRSKRTNGRDRRPLDDTKDRDREKDKEKEPAWMETYVPTTPGGGILGGQGEDGELDGIQAFKRGMKEKEKKEKDSEPSGDILKKSKEESIDAETTPSSENMDEIQLFKLIMKREATKKETEDDQKGRPPPGTDFAAAENATAPSTAKDILANVTAPEASSTPSGAATASEQGARLLSLISSSDRDTATSSPANSKPSSAITEHFPAQVSRLFPHPASSVTSPNDSSATSSAVTTPFNPPAGSRLLAFGSRAAPAPPNPPPPKNLSLMEQPIGPTLTALTAPSSAPMNIHNPQKMHGMTPPPGVNFNIGESMSPDTQYVNNPMINQRTVVTPTETSRNARSFSPFAQVNQGAYATDDIREAMRLAQQSDALRRGPLNTMADRAGYELSNEGGSTYADLGRSTPYMPSSSPSIDIGNGMSGANSSALKGSRFAKFFDANKREPQPGPTMRKGPGGPGFVSTSPMPGQRHDPLTMNNPQDNRAMEDIFAMLQNSSQNHRASPQFNQPGRVQSSGPFGPSPIDLQALEQQQRHLQQQQQQFSQHSRMDSLYDSRLDDRNFVPDGLVPGLRPAQRPRSREPTGVLFNEQLDDPLHFNLQRIQQQQQQQQRNLEQMYAGPAPTLYNQQAGLSRNGSIPLQQAQQFRTGPPQNQLPGPSQRLPPGLANLGARPPHDPSQFIGSPLGGPGNNLHGGIHPNAPAQQGFNNFGGGGLGYSGSGPTRGPVPHQNPLGMNQMAGMGHNNIDMRGPNQAQLLSMGGGGGGGMGVGLRGGGFNPEHGPTSQLQAQQMALRQQQQQHIPPHLLPHLLPPHIQQQQGIHGANPATQDLMALLMGAHRE